MALVFSRESRFPDRGRKFLLSPLPIFRVNVEKVDSPIGDENFFPPMLCFLDSVEKVDSPIGDENNYFTIRQNSYGRA